MKQEKLNTLESLYTPLQSLNNIRYNYFHNKGGSELEYFWFNRVETALKREDSIEITAIDIEQDNKELCKENKKLKRVIEIIKEKGVDVSLLIQLAKCGNGYIAYNNHLREYKYVGDLVNQHRKELTKEEYDLLKEVFIDE